MTTQEIKYGPYTIRLLGNTAEVFLDGRFLTKLREREFNPDLITSVIAAIVKNDVEKVEIVRSDRMIPIGKVQDKKVCFDPVTGRVDRCDPRAAKQPIRPLPLVVVDEKRQRAFVVKSPYGIVEEID